MNELPLMLYAEDDANDAFFMSRAFTLLRCPQALRVVSDGRQAVDYLSGWDNDAGRRPPARPQLVLLDAKMPNLSGLEVLAWIRERREFDALPVVMFTSSMQDSDVEFSRRHGANAYIVKPTNADRLSVFVTRLVSALPPSLAPVDRLALEGNLL